MALRQHVELDETYLVAGHKGQPQRRRQAERPARRRRLKGRRGRGTSAQEKPPVFGLVQRQGPVSLHVLPNVQRATIEPLVRATVQAGTAVYTDEYQIYNKLTAWGYTHHTVDHSKGEYARDADGDGKYEVHCNTQEGIWSLLRSWLRPYRGVSQEKLPFYVAHFEWLYNLKRAGKARLHYTIELLLQPDRRSYEQCLIPSV